MLEQLDPKLLPKWQKLVDLLVQTSELAAGYIVEPKPRGFQASVVSTGNENPLKAGDCFPPSANIYCRKVLETGEVSHIPDITKTPEAQKNNPAYSELGFVSYLGYPLKNVEGDTFATLCILGRVPTKLDDRYSALFKHCKNIIESDLQMALELRQANQEIENQRLMSRAVSHDLRNVMFITKGFANILEYNFSSSEQTQLNDICYRISAATSLAERMLDNYGIWNSVKSGAMQTEYVPVSVLNFIEEFRAINDVMLETKNITLVINIDTLCKVMITDSRVLFTILANLLHNAIKFTPRDSTITLEAKRFKDKVEFAVIDQGAGIPEELIGHLFQGDVVSSSKGTEGEKGTGLGNLICRKLSELIDAKLEIASSSSTGTNITLLVPDLSPA